MKKPKVKPTWDDLLLTDEECFLYLARLENKKDGNRDIDIHIDLTSMLKAQVRKVMDWAEKQSKVESP
jgi:hypothetical protein